MSDESIDVAVYPAGYLTEFILNVKGTNRTSETLYEDYTLKIRLLLHLKNADKFQENMNNYKVLGDIPHQCYIDLENAEIEAQWNTGSHLENFASLPNYTLLDVLFPRINIGHISLGMAESAYISMVQLLPQNIQPIAIHDSWSLEQLHHFLTNHLGAKALYA